MHGVGRGINRHVEPAPRDRGIEVREGPRDVVVRRIGPRPFGVEVDRRHEVAIRQEAELLGMPGRHMARPEDEEAMHPVHRYPASPALWSDPPRASIGSSASAIGRLGASATLVQAGAGLAAQRAALRSTVSTSGFL